MRYQIQLETPNATPSIATTQYSNRKSAEEAFELMAAAMTAGQTLYLVDRRTDGLMRKSHVDTPAELAERKNRSLMRYAERLQVNGRETLEKFAADVLAGITSNDPTYPMRWSDKAFAAAAQLSVCKMIAEMANAGTSYEEMLAYFRMRLRDGARKGSSSSQPSNFSEQCMTCEYADAVDQLEGLVKW